MNKKLIVLLCLFFIIIISAFIIYKKIQKEYLMETQRIVPNTETDVITIK